MASRAQQLSGRVIAFAIGLLTAVDSLAVDQHDVLPIVLLRCTTCHGARKQEGMLDLRTPAAMRRGGRSGPALVAGDPDASPVIQRIESEACPPGDQLLRYFVKRPPASEVATLRAWIAAGAPEVEAAPDVGSAKADLEVTDQDRRHWAFQTPRKPIAGDSVDDFILSELRRQGMSFAAEAGRETLIRRVAIDLTGMPPEQEAWRRWRSDGSTDWYARMVDELLASPRYGERWGRYWLDVAGYADSEGGVSADPLREVAWKYRDYVIAAFNQDKPYDRFLLEQLAGDELMDHERAPVVTEEMVANLVATGFLRMGIDQTGSRTMNFVPERLGVIGDALTVIGSGIMGLTLECARCHAHKYDPIPQRDYYRLKAVFQGAYDEHDWLSFKRRFLDTGTSEQRARVAKVNPPLERELRALQARLKQTIATGHVSALLHHAPDLDDADGEALLVALRKADNQRTLSQRILVEKLQRALLRPDSEQPEALLAARREEREIERAMADVKRRMAPSLRIRALWDRGDPSPTYLLRRGEHDKPGPLVAPGVPAVLADRSRPYSVTPPFPGGTRKSGRRLAFAKWLTAPDHPLTARVLVNRVWYHHFGAGLVSSLENFGVKGERPTHPELLDWLAVTFVERGWSLKELHRVIMNSRTYRQTSRVDAERLRIDPQNELWSRMPLRRMDAEALRDSLLQVAGRLDETPGGPPDPVTVDRAGLVSAGPLADGRWRRSVYLQYRRTEMPTMLATFDYPEMGPNCVQRNVSTVSPQALMLLNNDRVRELGVSFARRVAAAAGNAGEAQVRSVYALALSRAPTVEELRSGLEALAELRSAWGGNSDRALESFCHLMLNSAAFIFVD